MLGLRQSHRAAATEKMDGRVRPTKAWRVRPSELGMDGTRPNALDIFQRVVVDM